MLFDSYYLIVVFTISILIDQLLRLPKGSKSILIKIEGIFFYITLFMSFISLVFDAKDIKIIFITLFVFCFVYNAFVLHFEGLSSSKFSSQSIDEELTVADTNLPNDVVSEEQMIIEKIHRYFQTTEKYLDTDFDLDILEHDLNISRKKISQAINHQTGDNFYRFIAKYRINFAKELIVTHSNYSFDYLCNLSGFSSKTSFNRYFKDFVGITPKEYKTMLN